MGGGGAAGSGRVGRVGLILLGVLAAGAGGAAYLVHVIANPPRDRTDLVPADLLLTVEEVTFQAADGVPLSGWFVKGRPGSPAIVLAHDLGAARSSLLNSAAALNRAGYALFLFDFRGHGLSGGKGGSLGIRERQDVLGAIDYLKTRRDIDGGRLGFWGVGMGAYAGALAAVESDAIVSLALDSVYPDVATQLDRLVRARVPPALHTLLPAFRPVYHAIFGSGLRRFALADRLGQLTGRNVLFIASTEPPDRFEEEKALYAALPESASADKNFLELGASGITGLYAEDKKKYDQAIVGFFSTYLPRERRAAPRGPKAIQVLER
jgi:alpha-beta hydrolase superfamily lysophospholipase